MHGIFHFIHGIQRVLLWLYGIYEQDMQSNSLQGLPIDTYSKTTGAIAGFYPILDAQSYSFYQLTKS